ncbi:hypothetical protein KSS87_016706 [Heliosperma pusillum]|nr:hypothetical protein KSS87_016706 [Heliosperma pusillum]
MELHIIPVLTVLCVIIMGSHAALTPELYWKEALPNVAMPKSIKNSLADPEWMANKGTAVSVGKGGVHVDTGKSGGGATHVDVGHKGGVVVSTGKHGGGHTDVTVGPKGGVRVSTGKPYKSGPTVGVGKGGVIVHAGPKKKPVYVGVKPGPNPFKYTYAASETQLHDDPTRALFFLEKDMKLGHKFTMHFTRSTNGATFLTREEAQAVPFSTNKMTDILNEFSVKPGSEEAQVIEQTVKECESKGIQGEQKYCATSLEGMVDYAKSTLGKNVRAISTEAINKDNDGQKYTITAVRGVAIDDKVAVCHKQNYAYAVFYCHKTKGTSPYVVTLISDAGVKNKAVAICHKNTSGWNPKHLAFQVLNVKPGSVPICHFLPEDHIVWVRN